MKVKLAANAELDLLTKSEVSEVLRSWHQEVRAGVRYPMFAAQGIVAADNSITITGEQLGPTESFIWDIRRVMIWSPDDVISIPRLYVNDPSPARIVTQLSGVPTLFNPAQLVLNYGSQLYVTATGTTPGAIVTLAGQAKEVPYQLGWSL